MPGQFKEALSMIFNKSNLDNNYYSIIKFPIIFDNDIKKPLKRKIGNNK